MAAINSALPEAFTFDKGIADSLDGIIAGKTKARELYVTSQEKISAERLRST